MQKNNIKNCFDRTEGNTVDLKKDCSVSTGIHIRMIQYYYSDEKVIPTVKNILKLQQFFAEKWNREVSFDEIIIAHNNAPKKSAKRILSKI